MRNLTVNETAFLLGVSVGKVRRWCRLGELPATRVGKTWIINDQRIEQFGRLHDVDPEVKSEADFKKALRQIESLDLFEDWIPDILRYEDQLTEKADLLERTQVRYERATTDAATEIEIPKTSYFARTGHALALTDRIAYHAAVGTFVDKIDSGLLGVVFSSRLAPPGSRKMLRSGVQQWKRWAKYVRATVEAGNSWVVKTDIAAYFECIRHEILFNELSTLGADQEVLRRLRVLLSSWSHSPGQGIPQGPDASRVLGNFYMAPVDEVMLGEEFKYSRYMDDVRIAGESKPEVIRALRVFGRECRQRGLIVSPSKTKIFHGAEAAEIDLDATRDLAAYLMDTRQNTSAKKILREILADALATEDEIQVRDTRFSLRRLALLRDEGICQQIFCRLDDLAPVASNVSDYLSGFISRPFVQNELTSYLSDTSKVRDDYLIAFLFAAMLEHPGVIPASWVDYARRSTKDKGLPNYLRVIASNVLALGKRAGDLTWIRNEAKREGNEILQRGYATALRRAGHLDAGTSSVLSGRSDNLARAIRYLHNIDKLPSLVRPYSRSKTYRQLE